MLKIITIMIDDADEEGCMLTLDEVVGKIKEGFTSGADEGEFEHGEDYYYNFNVIGRKE